MNEVVISIEKPHPAQKQILTNAKRFNYLKCGRRFGKTHLIKELTTLAIYNHPIGIWFPTYKDLSEVWTELKYLYYDIIERKDESLKQIRLITGGIIDFWSMEDPDSGRGRKYKRVILDEFAKAKKNKQAWQQTIRPTLTDLKGDAWFLSTPKGKGNYFYRLREEHKGDNNWKFWKFTSYDNPHLDPKEIDDAKEELDDFTFQQEYLAEDVDLNEQPFLYSFSEEKHVTSGLEINKSLPVWLSFDFNVQPQTCAIAQRINNDTLHVIDLIKLDNASIYKMCDHIKVKLPYHLITTGDATGRNRSSTNNLSNWQIIKKELKLADSQIRLRMKNLDHRTSQVICNSVLEHKNILIDKRCTELIEDCIFASVDEHGKLIKTVDRGLHFFDCFVGDTFITIKNGTKKIKDLKIGEFILSRFGYDKIIDKWDSYAEVFEFILSDGTSIKCTKTHKFYTFNFGFLSICDILDKNLELCKLSTKESYSENTKNNHISIQPKKADIQKVYIDKFGLIISEKSQKDTMYTIRMETHSTIRSKILKLLKAVNILVDTCEKDSKKIHNHFMTGWIMPENMLQNGINQKKEKNYTQNYIHQHYNLISKHIRKNANNAERNLKHLQQAQIDHCFVPTTANQITEENQESIMKQEFVNIAAMNLLSTNMQKQNYVLNPVRIVSVKKIGIQKVYDITTESNHEFFANNILAHNCFRYLLDANFPNILAHK